MPDNKKFPSDDEAAEWLDKWSNREAPYDQAPLDYEVKPGQGVPPTYKASLLDRLWKWFRP